LWFFFGAPHFPHNTGRLPVILALLNDDDGVEVTIFLLRPCPLGVERIGISISITKRKKN